ncbi:hypothetical protein ACP4OV_015842 [Aristida adscensionis]
MNCRYETRMPPAPPLLLLLVAATLLSPAPAASRRPPPPAAPPLLLLMPANLELYKGGQASAAVAGTGRLAAAGVPLPPPASTAGAARATAAAEIVPPSGQSQCGNSYDPWTPIRRCGDRRPPGDGEA